jgi:putative Holliday junction resolvase
LAIDLGLKRIGLAYSPDNKLALPLKAIIRKNRVQAAAAVQSVIAEYNVDAVAIGVAIGGESEEETRRRAAHFAGLLKLEIPVFYQDEAFSSQEAARLAKGRLGKAKDGRLDSLSAMIILERFLERKCANLFG